MNLEEERRESAQCEDDKAEKGFWGRFSLPDYPGHS